MRFAYRSPAKLRDEATGRYEPIETVDLSAGGALLRLRGPGRLQPGQAVRVGIPEHARTPLLTADAMRPARVVRSLARDGQAYAAVAFDEVIESALAAAG